VVDLGNGRFGLISGWRRLQALTALQMETGEDRFATVQALLRRPNSASAAYLAMVEENEIRVGLGHYERARIAARAVEQGVYPGLKAALNHLFQNVSRAKRSKIGSFVTVYQALDGSLRFPAALPERLGLSLAQALEADASLADRVKTALASTAPATAAEEQAHLARLLRPAGPGGMADAPARPTDAVEPAPGIWLQVANGPQGARYTLSGPSADAAFGARLAEWLGVQRQG
jgi:ParB family chromosome partitioning protein